MSLPSGLQFGLGGLSLLTDAETRSLSAENPTGERGKGGMSVENLEKGFARELGQGWKVRPSLTLGGNETAVLADVEGPGVIQHIWITVDANHWRRLVLRMYWDGEETPSVEVPLGDFFACAWRTFAQVNSLPVAVNAMNALNCYWEMPFSSRARITVENLRPDPIEGLFYQVTYAKTGIPENSARFHAQFRREDPTEYQRPYTILDGVKGQGHYVGTYLAWQTNSDGWWGEGEVKFFLDGDGEFPTICGTGTEDYFGGAWGFTRAPGVWEYQTYSTPFLGFHLAKNDGAQYRAGNRFGMYRWHVMDPIRFREDLKVTVQALGWREALGGTPRYLPLKDDIASTAFWYQAEPHGPFPALPAANELEVH